MATDTVPHIPPRSKPSRLPPVPPIAVPPRVAWAMLGIGKTTH